MSTTMYTLIALCQFKAPRRRRNAYDFTGTICLAAARAYTVSCTDDRWPLRRLLESLGRRNGPCKDGRFSLQERKNTGWKMGRLKVVVCCTALALLTALGARAGVMNPIPGDP